MAEKTTVARPYAEAVFELAHERKALPEWSAMLQLAAAVVADEQIARLVGNPRVERGRVTDLVLAVCGEKLNAEGQNLIRVLVENDRLGLLPEIAVLYEEYRAEAERTVEVRVRSAFPLDEAAQKRVAQAVKKRLGREVTLSCEVDADLLGGAIIRAGDLVIDGSVTGQLQRLTTALSR